MENPEEIISSSDIEPLDFALNGIKQTSLYKEARQFMKDAKFDEAAECYSNLLKACGAKGIDMEGECAFLWYAYGDALLSHEEANPSDDLLGTAASEAKKAAAVLASELSKEEDNVDNIEESHSEDELESDDGDEATENQNEVKEEEDDDDGSDMRIAWEALEVARDLCEKFASEENDSLLPEVYSRLGDLLRFNGAYVNAIDEYQRALNLRTAASNSESDRSVAETHFLMANAHIYFAGEGTEGEGQLPLSEAVQLKEKALGHYIESHKILMNALALLRSHEENSISTENKEIDDVQDVIDELSETIEALKEEIKSNRADLGNSSSSSSAAQPQTSIGFGNVSSSSSASAFNFGTTSAEPVVFNWGGSSSTALSADVPIMQVKKKVKLTSEVV